MYTIIGKIDNFDKRKGYPEFGIKPIRVETRVVELAKPVITRVVKAKKSINKLLKKAKHEFKLANPNHKDKILASSKLN